jgi:phospholipase C
VSSPPGIFARPPFLGGGWVCVAEGDAQVNQNFAQKRFALRPVIETKQRNGEFEVDVSYTFQNIFPEFLMKDFI